MLHWNDLSLMEMGAAVPLYMKQVWVWAIWMKARTIYVVNNWIYTTNHRRIAVNYFWFVIFAGIVGMALATIIRLEMAYPGLGILAGDSLQYLSVVTAHAVVMVFFMIMPLKFGAFGNFLLPTQLGVHDVAFPRLNSAAFWFLPAGLIMLCQLVCLDRRYQRMNCYNIREIQSILRNKHFVDLFNTADHRDFMNTVMVALRFKMNGEDITKADMLLFFHLGTLNYHMNGRIQTWLGEPIVNVNTHSFFSLSSFRVWTANMLNNMYVALVDVVNGDFAIVTSVFPKDLFAVFSGVTRNFVSELVDLEELNSLSIYSNNFHLSSQYFGNLFGRSWMALDYSVFPWLDFYTASIFGGSKSSVLYSPSDYRWSLVSFGSYQTLIALVSPITWLGTNVRRHPVTVDFIEDFITTLLSSLNYSVTALTSQSSLSSLFNKWVEIKSLRSDNIHMSNLDNDLKSLTSVNDSLNLTDKISYANEELTSNFRQQRFQNPVFRYNYKIGHYFTKADVYLNSTMFTTQSELTGGIRKSAWFLSPMFSELFSDSAQTYLNFISKPLREEAFADAMYTPSRVRPTDGFYNFFLLLSESNDLINCRWLSVNTLDQKFYKMFATSSMQQRIYGNWRQLKFTREAWRCRLLASRHQKTLYKRYTSEEGLFWSVERNAKDVLPGWAMITPFAARTRFTAIGKVDIGLMGVFLVLNSSIVSSANFLVTYRYLSTLNNRKMRDARSFFTEGVMVASWMMIAANPMLAIGILMLLSDRHWQTSFFDYSGGGDTVLFQHMFWFFGHPEVYVIMIPAFGFNNTLLSFYLRKRVSARASLMYSMYTIAFLGFFVWGHHMYMVGLAHTTRMLFSTLTVMISVPAATKLMHWCVTLVNSSFWVEVPFLFSLLFIFFFVSGGISGMAVAHTGMDILFHDSFYVIGHFHVMFAGAAMFASFGAFYFYFPSIFGVKFSRIWGYLHIIYFLLGQLMTVIPMFWLGYSGMPRRVLDYPASLGGWHAIVSAGHMLSVAGLMAFFIMIFDSLRQGRAATRNSFGISRFNTRFNFYLYEIARTRFVQRKGWYLSRYNRPESLSLNELNYTNNEVLETTLYSYVLVQVK